MTRIIRSLRVLGLEEEALAFYTVISQVNAVSEKSRMYWKRAATRPLNIAPHVDDEDIGKGFSGPEFLKDFEWEKEVEVKSIRDGHKPTTSKSRDESTGASSP
jgi:hypothetical protein